MHDSSFANVRHATIDGNPWLVGGNGAGSWTGKLGGRKRPGWSVFVEKLSVYHAYLLTKSCGGCELPCNREDMADIFFCPNRLTDRDRADLWFSQMVDCI